MQTRLGTKSKLQEHLALRALHLLCQLNPDQSLTIEDIAVYGWDCSSTNGATQLLKSPGLDLDHLPFVKFMAELRGALGSLQGQGLASPVGFNHQIVWQSTAGGQRALKELEDEIICELRAGLEEWQEGCEYQ